MTKFKLGSSAVAALLISSIPAFAQDSSISIDQSVDQELNQTCGDGGVNSKGQPYTYTTDTSGDCVAVLLGSNFAVVAGNNNGPTYYTATTETAGTTGDSSIIIDQNLEQELNQTNTGEGDATAVVVGGNTAIVAGNNNGPTFGTTPGNYDEDATEADDMVDEHKDYDMVDEHKDYDMVDEHKDGDMVDEHEDGDMAEDGDMEDKEFNDNNGFGNGDQDAPGNSGDNNNAENASEDRERGNSANRNGGKSRNNGNQGN